MSLETLRVRENVYVCIHVCVRTLWLRSRGPHVYITVFWSDLTWSWWFGATVFTSGCADGSASPVESLSTGSHLGGDDGSHACTDLWWAIKLMNKHYLKYLKGIDLCVLYRCVHADWNLVLKYFILKVDIHSMFSYIILNKNVL